MVQRVIYADNEPKELECLLHKLGFGLYNGRLRQYGEHAQLEVQVVAIHDPDGFGHANSKSRMLVSDRHHENGFEVPSFCDAAKPVYGAILKALKNALIYDPMNQVDF